MKAKSEKKIFDWLKKACDAEGRMNSYCSKIAREIYPHLPPANAENPEYEDFGVQWMTDGICCYFDEMIVPVGVLIKFLSENSSVEFSDIKKLAI